MLRPGLAGCSAGDFTENPVTLPLSGWVTFSKHEVTAMKGTGQSTQAQLFYKVSRETMMSAEHLPRSMG
ncbi:hypothetical protein D2T29_19145 [Sinirhodobacter populi]|uniref:Uncharacterized protein n=1 Tax=Paenirhodobacter populi TaxID=2306993 RepID=A0A443K378_9RHOB|nr:hypothetical protein [Sinirhodobacter populi]RWR27202.1 hypothetical protein D2T29_19145 [Sinirhodobacter populi]